MKASTGLLLVVAAIAVYLVVSKSASTASSTTSTLPSNQSGATTLPVSSLGVASTQYVGSTPIDNFDSGGDPSSGDDNSNSSLYDAGVSS